MFGLFKKNYFLGIDFGTSSIKVVELKLHKQRLNLSNYGWIKLGFAQSAGDFDYDKKLKAYLQALVNKMEPKTESVYVSMPSFSGLVSLIEFPDMKKEELDQAIRFEARKYVPTSLDEISISWDIVSKKDDKAAKKSKSKTSEKIQILLVAAPKDKVIKYEDFVKSADLKVKAIELETFSLARSLVGDDAGTFLIIDIGFRACSIVLVEKGVVKVNRNIDAGGNEITDSIAENLNISKKRAEDLKKQGKDFINSRESSIVLPTLDLIANEALRIISTYKEKNSGSRIDGVVLSGGTAKLKGVDDYFSKALGIKTIIGDPWKKIVYDESLSPIVKKVGPSFSVALGLALKGVEEYKRS
ncbi:competence protein A [bacterium BMS3Abin15]|nr:competence protein A [bacterium BMS3Abin15]HDH07492.1 type IV pilus assembly protein PilM [Candidatus Moranbacteria bacterium]HDZ85328.1 type IV pilus assembly protein PilM [Candidatus Moranbacteria bacterium]